MAFAQNMQCFVLDRYGSKDWAQISQYMGSDFDVYYPLGLKKREENL